MRAAHRVNVPLLGGEGTLTAWAILALVLVVLGSMIGGCA